MNLSSKPCALLTAVVLVVASCASAPSATPSESEVQTRAASPAVYSAAVEGDDPHKPEQPVQQEQEQEQEQPVQQEQVESSGQACEAEFVSEDLSSNRGNSLAMGRLQVVLFYDGDPESSPELRIGLGQDDEIVVGGQHAGGPVETFGRTIETREYELFDCVPNGSFIVSGVVPNGVIDGLAFAAMWRGVDGRYTMVKSNTVSSAGATYVGMWPLGFSRESFAERTPQISDNFGRETARGLLIGSALMPNGVHQLGVPSAG